MKRESAQWCPAYSKGPFICIVLDDSYFINKFYALRVVQFKPKVPVIQRVSQKSTEGFSSDVPPWDEFLAILEVFVIKTIFTYRSNEEH